MEKLLLEVKSEISADKERNAKIQEATEEIKKSIKIRKEMLRKQDEFNPTEFFNLSFYNNYMECVLYWVNHKDFDSKYWNCLNYLKYLYREYKNCEFNMDYFFSKETLKQIVEVCD
jgi:hypothetical protein